MSDKNIIALAEVRNNYSLKKYGNLNSEQVSLLKYDELCVNLIKENQELKAALELYENGVYFSSEIDEKDKEIDKLKKQLEEYQLQNIDLRTDIMIQKKAFPHKEIKDKTFFDLYDMPTYEDLLNQQKEFIEYMTKTIEELECDNVDDEEMKGYLIQRIDTFKEILSKFREIIGNNEQN